MNVRVNRSLAREDFPFTIWCYRSDDLSWCWGVTLLEPPDSRLHALYVPPLARWEGVPIVVETETAQGVQTLQRAS